jgi:hypothetical protein
MAYHHSRGSAAAIAETVPADGPLRVPAVRTPFRDLPCCEGGSLRRYGSDTAPARCWPYSPTLRSPDRHSAVRLWLRQLVCLEELVAEENGILSLCLPLRFLSVSYRSLRGRRSSSDSSPRLCFVISHGVSSTNTDEGRIRFCSGARRLYR